MEEPQTGLGRRIQERLKVVHLSAEGASKLAGMGRDGIRNIVNGKSKNGRGDNIAALAVVLGTTSDWLQTGKGPADTSRPSTDPEEALRAKIEQTPGIGPIDRDIETHGDGGKAFYEKAVAVLFSKMPKEEAAVALELVINNLEFIKAAARGSKSA